MNKRGWIGAGLVMMALCVTTSARAYPEYVKPAGAAACTSCHNDSHGNGFKSGILNAFEQGGLSGLYDFLHPDTNPVIRPINGKWDITVGEAPLIIPVKVYDAEQDSFALHGSAPTGYSLSSIYTDSATRLPTINFRWSPSATQANKLYSFSVYAQETGDRRTLRSNTVTVLIQVWPPRTSATRYVGQFQLQQALWQNKQLKLAGSLVFKSTTTAAQRMAALAALSLSIKNAKGETLHAPVKLSLQTNGAWYKSLTLTRAEDDDGYEEDDDELKPPCAVKLEYEGFKVARSVVSTAPEWECED